MLYLHFFHSSGSPDIDDALFIVFSSWHVIDTMMIITRIMRMQRPDGPSICETATECWVSAHQWCQHRTILGLNGLDPSSSSDWKGLSVMKHPGILVLGKYVFFCWKIFALRALSPPWLGRDCWATNCSLVSLAPPCSARNTQRARM